MHFLSRVALASLTIALAFGSLFRSKRSFQTRAGSAALEEDHLVAADGCRLPITPWLPAGQAEAFALGLHAYADCRESFAATGAWFADRGIAFYAYDQRGFGETAQHGTWPGVQPLILDLADAVTVLRERHGEIPGIVLGESMGAAVALAGMGQGAVNGVDALIASAPAVCGGMAPRRIHDQALRLAAPALPWFAEELERGGQPWLQPAAIERLGRSPHVLRRFDTAHHQGLVELMRLASALPKAPMPPTLVLRGDLDTVVAEVAIQDLMLKLGATGVQRAYPEHHHLILQAEGYDAVLNDTLNWLTTTLRRS